MKPKHIIHVSSYYPPHLGGQENAVAGLAQQLARTGHEVDILTSTMGGGPKGLSVGQGVRINRLNGIVLGHAPILPWFPVALFRTVRPHSIVHVHIGQAFTPEMVWLVSKLRGFKYVAQLHIDFEPSGPAGVLLPLYKQLILKRALRAAHSIVVLNEKTLQVVRNVYGYTGHALIMSNGIDEAYFTLKRPPFAPKPPATLHLLFVGRLTKQKNLAALLAALRITKRDVHLDIVGDGAQSEPIKKIIRDTNLTNVTMHGRLSGEDVMQFYKQSDALVMPSLYEAQPLVLLEALAARIPIIGTDVIGIAEHIKDAGIIVEPTPEGLAEGIEEYYTQYPLLPHMVKIGYSSAENSRWSRTLRQYEALYEN